MSDRCPLGYLLLFVILVISHFGFEGWVWVLIASVPGIYIFLLLESRIYNKRERIIKVANAKVKGVGSRSHVMRESTFACANKPSRRSIAQPHRHHQRLYFSVSK